MATGRFSAASAQNAPSPNTKGNLVLFDFGDANDKQIRDAAIARFNKRYPNVKVTDQFTPISSWSDYLNKLVTQIASGKVPDLIHIATEGVQLAVRKNLDLTDPKFLEALKFVHGLVRENGVSPDPANTDPNAVFQLFTAGKIAMTGGGHWPMQFFKANKFNDFDVVPWPKNKAQKTVFGADGWGISTKTKQKAIAWEMVKELTSAESQQQAAGLGVAIPARRSVAESKEFLAQPEHAALFYESLRYAAPVQAPVNYAEIERILMQHLGQVMADEVKPEEALKAANEELSAAMQQQAAEGQ